MDKKERKVRYALTAVAGIILLLVVYFAGVTQGYYGKITANNFGAVFKNELQRKQLGKTDFSLFWDVADDLRNKYYGDINSQDMLYGSIKGLVAAIGDPYTIFADPAENSQFFDTLNGSYEGIGVELDVVDGALVVLTPLKGSPAEASGLKTGDEITAVDGKSIVGMTFANVLSLIKGPAGSQVNLTIIREGVKDPLVLKITRQTIKRDSVSMEMGKDKIAVITITRFATDTDAGFKTAVNKVIADGAKGVVLDLRNNPGGFLDSGVKVANEFLKSGLIVEERTKTGEKTSYSADGSGRLTTIPLTVLMNGGSASAAEIVAGALQDNGRAKIVGEQSYGKGSVQEVEEFPDGSALRVTVGKWYTPKGTSISDSGITPDKKVELTGKETTDVQLTEAKKLLK
jgi:carboxyl-terminal processing protease